MKLKLVLATIALSLTTTVMADGAGDAITAAKAARDEAKAVGFEWLHMKPMIKQAEALAKDGKSEKAIEIANQVVKHGKAALAQAKLGKTASPEQYHLKK